MLESAHGALRAVPFPVNDPERIPVQRYFDADFYRDWGLTLLNLALQRLEEEQQASGKGELFNHLKGHLAGAKDLTSLSETIGIPVNTLKSDLHRFSPYFKDS